MCVSDYDADGPCPQTQRGSHRTSQESPWLLEGQKSNISQQAVRVRAEFTGDTEKADIFGASGRLKKERSMSLICSDMGVFY